MAQSNDGRGFDAIVVGAGFAGMYMLHRLRGQGLSVRVFEAGKGVGVYGQKLAEVAGADYEGFALEA